MRRQVKVLIAFAAALAGLGATAAPAGALSITSEVAKEYHGSFVVSGSPGEANNLSWSSGTSHSCPAAVGSPCVATSIIDTAGITFTPDTDPPPSCQQISPTEIRCILKTVDGVTMQLGDLNDTVQVRQCAFPLCGGAWVIGLDDGNDTLAVSSTDAAGNKATAGPFTHNNVTARGGAGADRILSTVPWAPSTVSSSSMPGSSRTVFPGSHLTGRATTKCTCVYSYLFGDAGPDFLRIKRGAGTANGGEGNDVLGGGPGPQRFIGGRGNDLLKNPGPGRDTGNGGPGRDRVHGDPHVNDPGGWDD